MRKTGHKFTNSVDFLETSGATLKRWVRAATKATNMMRAVMVCLLVGLAACGGPVRGTNCEIVSSPKHGTVLRAMLANDSGKTVTHVGVLVERVGLEYEFPVHIEAHRSTPIILGTPYGDPYIRITKDTLGPIRDDECWARVVNFTDGTAWIVSPL